MMLAAAGSLRHAHVVRSSVCGQLALRQPGCLLAQRKSSNLGCDGHEALFLIVQAAEFLADPVKVTIGSADLSASHSVSQVQMKTSDQRAI
jgi:hypothetical protein